MTLRERYEWIAFAEESEENQKLFIEKCRRDPVFFINTCLWTEDPRKRGKDRLIPFLLFPRQELLVWWIMERRGLAKIEGDIPPSRHELDDETIEERYSWKARSLTIQEIWDGEDGLIPKSRDTGCTKTCLGLMLHGWLFEDFFRGGLGSKKEDFVDKVGYADALFYTLDMYYRNLPEFLQVPEYKPQSPWRSHMQMTNPRTGGSIVGEPPTPDFMRGGRFSWIFTDELAAWDNAEEAWTACGESTYCRIAGSTPRGMNHFGKLCNPEPDAETGLAREGIKTFKIHWKDDKRHCHFEEKDDGARVYPYYEARRKRYNYDDARIAQELDISFEGSVTGKVYPQIKFAGKGSVPYVPSQPLYDSWDFGGDTTAILWGQYDHDNRKWRIIDYYENKGMDIYFYVPFITGIIGDTKYEYTEAEIAMIQRHRGWRYDGHFGDPTGINKNIVSNTSVVDALASKGIHIITNQQARDFGTRRARTQFLLPRTDFDAARCRKLIDAIANSRYPSRSENSQATAGLTLPVHDWASHGRTCFEYLAVNDPFYYTAEGDPDVEGYMEDMQYPEIYGGDPEKVKRMLARAVDNGGNWSFARPKDSIGRRR